MREPKNQMLGTMVLPMQLSVKTEHFLNVLFADLWLFQVWCKFRTKIPTGKYLEMVGSKWTPGPCAQTGVKVAYRHLRVKHFGGVARGQRPLA